ncbi:MAG: bifunctional DNA-formamidopyrimidine glycosylase/DNA-(apurinic or apyrimidinic site) lyase [Desulfopila sp.]|jgi:formamidopyrimidine-DNA glycosylase|nr:bifunctional DNA-formamidopyrimidine glycosylase/DNA-(apurinic or apyrimidinic site) lyase [Desulfopila sp.]
MPELPEVEVVRRGLIPLLQGRRIIALADSGKSLRYIAPLNLLRGTLRDAVITEIGRRAKYLLFSTHRDDLLILHLGMTGKLGIFPTSTAPAKHDHLIFTLDNGMDLRFNDARRFGAVHIISSTQRAQGEKKFFQEAGPEPLGKKCTSTYLHKRAAGSRQAIKTFIMNGKILAGVGNIYANESLFAAGIHPGTPACSLTGEQWRVLLKKIRQTLRKAIECGGSTISDFLNAGGESGYFQMNFKVYGRQGEACPSCPGQIVRETINGRAAFFCPICQQK